MQLILWQRFGSQERESSTRKNSCLPPINYTRDESQMRLSRPSTSLTRKWNSASPDNRCKWTDLTSINTSACSLLKVETLEKQDWKKFRDLWFILWNYLEGTSSNVSVTMLKVVSWVIFACIILWLCHCMTLYFFFLNSAGLVSEELEHRIGMIETSLSRFGIILDSVQSDIMQANKGTKEVLLESKFNNSLTH